jgi:Tol biopolymer transport system component
MVCHRIATVFAVATMAIAASPADAAFPGRNGRLAVVVESNGNSVARLITMRPDGSHRRGLRSTGSSSALWSPDGRSIVLPAPCPRRGCEGNEGGATAPGVLLIVDATTGQTRRIHTSQTLRSQGPQVPSWTANGGLLWVRSNPDDGGEAAVIKADRRGRHQRVVPMQGQLFSGIARASPVGG